MKDFLVKMARYEEILIRADNAKDAAAMAASFNEDCWNGAFEIHVEEADSKADRGGEGVKYPEPEAKGGKKKKKQNRRWKWKCLCQDNCLDDDIPF